MGNYIKSHKILFLILALCIVLRLLFFLAAKPWIPETEGELLQGDALGYHQLATTLVQNFQFSFQVNGPPNSFRTPGYPVFVALFYFVFGTHLWIVLLSQIILDTISCALIFLIFSRIFTLNIGYIGSLFYSLDPFLILHTSTLLSDLLFVLFIVIGTYWFSFLFDKNIEKIKLKIFLWSGLSFGLATLVRPISMYIPIILSLFILYRFRKNLLPASKYVFILVFAFGLTILPWLLRNYYIFNNFSLSSASSSTLIEMYVPPMEMERRGQSYDEVTTSLLNEADSLMRRDGINPENLNEFQKSKYLNSVAFKYIFKYPFPFMKHYALGTLRYFVGFATENFSNMLNLNSGEKKELETKTNPSIIDLISIWFQQKSSAQILIVSIIFIFLLISYSSGLIGLIISWKNFNNPFLILCIVMVMYFAILAGPQGMERYKLPSIPFYLAFTGIGLNYIFKVRRERKNNLRSWLFIK